MNSTKTHRYTMAWLALMILLGASLRLWSWSSQLLLDDEWHALNFVLNRSFADVVLQQGMGANSIPVNIYSWILLHTTGWSEPLLRLPSIAAGVAALVVIPLLVQRLWGDAVAGTTAALLAVSPVVIFYSRITRPYAPAMLLATVSVLLTFSWLNTGRRRDLLLSALCGSLAIYYHLYTAIPIGVPFLVALAAALPPVGRRLGLVLESKRPFRDLLMAAGIMIAIVGVLVVIPNVINPWWSSRDIHNMDHANLETAVTVLSLIAGTRAPLLMAVVLGLLLAGLVMIVQRSRTIGGALVLAFSLFSAVMAVTTQDGAHAGIQVVRYGITFIPLSFVAIAVALARIGAFLRDRYPLFQRPHLLAAAAAAVWIPFLASSPLWTTYAPPNNFTSHSAYQYRYDPIRWQQRSPERDLAQGISMEYGNISPFYLQSPLLANAKGIIEYPMLIGDQLNLYYYYQHFHRLPVVAGFVSSNVYAPVEPGHFAVFGDWPVDSVMSAMPEQLRGRASWHAMADLDDVDSLRRRFKGWLLVVHRDPFSEITNDESPGYTMSQLKLAAMIDVFGNPRYFDDKLAVWTIE